MDEQEFDAVFQAKPFGSEDAKRADLRRRRGLSLASILWSQTSDDLQRQLMAPSPHVPPGFELADFRELLRATEELLAAMRQVGMESRTIIAGMQRYTEWEARCEIVRRAIEYLENH